MDYTIFRRRREELGNSLPDQSALFLFSGEPKQKSMDLDFPFAPDRNFYYLTGLTEPGYILLMTKLHGKLSQQLFLARPDPYLELYHGKMPTAGELQAQACLDQAHYLDKLDWELGRLFSRNSFEVLCMDFHKRELDTTAYPEHDLAKRIVSAHPYLTMKNIAPVINNMRRVKTPDEIENIREAVRLTGLGIESILRHMKPGVGEWQLQAYFDFELKFGGAMGNAFSPIIASGSNSVSLHYERNDQILGEGLLLLDLGAEYKYYSADISRTFPISGKFTAEERHYYEAVLKAQEAILKALKPGYPIDDTLELARDVMYPYCREAGTAKDRADMAKLLPHGVCHYLGLDTHDVGDRVEVCEGMTVAIEPGLYFPEKGFGIRIEDDALVTASGCELISGQILKDPDEIEDFINGKL